MSKVIGSNLAKLESSYALEIASNLSQYLQYSIQTAPSCPRSGELYLFATESPLKKDNWKYDHLKWINNSSRTCQRGSFLLKLHYFTINIGLRNRGLFFKQVYTTQVNSLYIALIYYHGNNDHAIKTTQAHTPKKLNRTIETTPVVSTLVATKEEQISYSEMSLYSPVQTIPEATALRMQYSVQLENELAVPSHMPTLDGHKRQVYTFSLQQKAEQVPNFIYFIASIPKLVVLFGFNDLIQEFRHLLRTHPSPQEISISLDAVLTLDNFHATPVYINYPRFVENPTFPVLVLLHESKSAQIYNSLFSQLSELIPELLNDNFITKLDGFDGLLGIAKKHLPNLTFEIEDSTQSRNPIEMITKMLPNNSLEPLEFIEIIGKHQKEILREISQSYKSEGNYHLHSIQSSIIPSTYLNNNVYQILKVKEISSQSSFESIQITGDRNWCQGNSIDQFPEETGNIIMMESKSPSSEEQVYNGSLVITEQSYSNSSISDTI